MELQDLNRSQHPTIRFLIQIRVVFGLYIHITDSARHGKSIFFEAGGVQFSMNCAELFPFLRRLLSQIFQALRQKNSGVLGGLNFVCDLR